MASPRTSALVLDFGAGEGREVLPVLAQSLMADEAVAQAVEAGTIEPVLRPFLRSLLGLPLLGEERQLVDATAVSERQRRLQEAFLALARSAAAKRPLLLIVEDVHWADDNTLAGLALAAGGLAALPVLLLLTTRREGDPIDGAWLASAGSPTTTVVELRPLRDTDAQQLAASCWPGPRTRQSSAASPERRAIRCFWSSSPGICASATTTPSQSPYRP